MGTKAIFVAVLFYFCLVTQAIVANSALIDNPSFFATGSVTIDFEINPETGVLFPAEGVPLSTQYSELGVVFSSEDEPGILQSTDVADTDGRFEDPFQILATVADGGTTSGGGAPTSGARYASGNTWDGLVTSDMRIDFLAPGVCAFGFFLIDNDFTPYVRIAAYDASGTLLEKLFVPQVVEGGVTYRGIRASGISYVIIDAVYDVASEIPIHLDSSFIDDFSFIPRFNDDDCDGMLNVFDPCPNSDITVETVMINGCDSGVANQFYPSGCTTADLFAGCETFGCINSTSDKLEKSGIIAGHQRDAILACWE